MCYRTANEVHTGSFDLDMETLRVIWLNWRDITNPAAGGAELYTHQVAMRLARKGHEVTLFTSKYPGCREEEEKDGVSIVRKGTASTVYLEAPRFFSTQTRKRIRYDVIVDAINTVPFLSPLYAGSAFVIALLYQLTGEIFLKEFAHPLGHMFYALERSSHIPWYLRRADHIVTLSDSTKAELIGVCSDLDPDKVSVIPPGSDHDHFVPGCKSDEPVLLFMNRLVQYKQPEHIIMAMKDICAHVGNAKLIMVGTLVSGRYAKSLMDLVSSLGLESKVSFLLSRPFASSKITLFQRAWIHVLPSMKEGFGLSILEAAACGTPTVGYDVPGARDAVIQGKTGVLVPSGDTVSLGSCVTELLTDNERRRMLGDQATGWAKNFLWDDTARHFANAMKHA